MLTLLFWCILFVKTTKSGIYKFIRQNTDTFKRANVLCPDIIRASWQIMNTLSKNEDGLKGNLVHKSF